MSINPSYIDIDLNFKRHPGTKDVTKKYDTEATKQAIRNIFLTNPFEKPFDPEFGLGIERWLFEQNASSGGILSTALARKIREMLYIYEPRVVVDYLNVSSPRDSNAMNIELTYHTLMNSQQDSLSFSFRRVR